MQDPIPLAHALPWEKLGLERSEPLRPTPLSKLSTEPIQTRLEQKALSSGEMDLVPGAHPFNVRRVLLQQRVLLCLGVESFQTLGSEEDAAGWGWGGAGEDVIVRFPSTAVR